ncbi:MAG: hypothetical protein DMD60_09400 [Gemmatimonadetes bacterium]|nr:MAG: hypothetical protein DMD60_09400 [Gemmatimonadota bacterium]
MSSRVVSVSVVLLAVAGTAPAQSIPIHTVPLVPADQFDIFPSSSLAMGEVSIAVPDTLHDPFVNPAKAARVRAARFFTSPTLYDVSRDAGAGRTLPLGVLGTAGSWFGGLALALQQVDASHPPSSSVNTPLPVVATADPSAASFAPSPANLSPAPDTHGNALAFALLGTTLPGSGVSLGGSVSWAKLRALDGVDLLYPGSARVTQFGETVNARLGLLKEWDGDRSLEAIVLHERFRMTHDVTFLDTFWDPGTRQFSQSARLERNRDVSKRWGVQIKYERPLPEPGWRIGWLATANRTSQPNTPNTDALNIPQDPGQANAYELGVGVSRRSGPGLFGMDVVYQPIWSTTWAEASAPTATSGGGLIPVGGRTVENGFHFSNALLRLGVSREVARSLTRTVTLQLGLLVRSIHYNLAQRDFVEGATRQLKESWAEWTPTWGLSLRHPEFELCYRGRVSHGTDRLVVTPSDVIALADARPIGSFFFPSSIPPNLTGVHVFTHQFSVSFPLR